MVTVREVPPDAPWLVAAVRALEDANLRALGHESLNGEVWADLMHPTTHSAGFAALAAEPAEPANATVAYAHLSWNDSVTSPHHSLGLVVDPGSADAALAVPSLLEASRAHVAAQGGGLIVLWIMGADDHTDARLAPARFLPVREQHQMRVPLPAPKPQWPSAVTVRTFEPDRDEDAWVEVNNRAFSGHPEQGGWTIATLRQRENESWFDPQGFLLATDADGLAGFCWTKVHDDSGPDDRLGEIYVIATDPARQGIGLGRALVLGGLEHLHRARHCPTGLLYVDAANTAAVSLYRSLGFEITRSDRAYECLVEAA